jgi:Ca2+-binding RTX toxin-like protein
VTAVISSCESPLGREAAVSKLRNHAGGSGGSRYPEPVSGRRKQLGRGVVIAFSAVAIAAPGALGAEGVPAAVTPVTCAYVEQGAPGPADNDLQINEAEFGSVEVRRSGSQVQVIDMLAGNAGQVVTCSGPQATVENIDRVHVTMSVTDGTAYTYFWLDESGGMLGPGATPETDGQSAIEVQVDPTTEHSAIYVKLIGQPGSDQIVVDDQQRALLADLDGGDPAGDPELRVQDAAFLDVYAGDGDDTVLVPGSQAFEHTSIKGQVGNDNLAANGADISGGPGDDTIHGGWFGEFFHGDAGNDRIYGGKGPDHLSGGPGRDFLSGGPGGDFLRGGAGKDKLRGGAGRDHLTR